MSIMRVLPPPTGPYQTMKVNGRTYSAAPGNTLDVPDFDATVLAANGWTIIGLVGTTSQRPAILPQGIKSYIDTTLGAPVFHDGANYRRHDGTAA